MYVDIHSVSYDAANQEAIIKGIDLDSVLLNDWNQEFSDAEVTFRFDISGKGPRIYLYKLLRSQVKDDCSSMEEMLLKLSGKITNITVPVGSAATAPQFTVKFLCWMRLLRETTFPYADPYGQCSYAA